MGVSTQKESEGESSWNVPCLHVANGYTGVCARKIHLLYASDISEFKDRKAALPSPKADTEDSATECKTSE